MTDALDHLMRAATNLVRITPTLSRFAPWDTGPRRDLAPASLPTVSALVAWDGGHIPATRPLHDAVRAACPLAHWRQTYSVEEVGQRFLDTYGWFELAGPTGHFVADGLRAYIGFWGPDLVYPMHAHEAEEIYFILSGRARFISEGLPDAMLHPGESRLHHRYQRHAMKTEGDPVLTLVLWRGTGLEGRAQITPA
mgnify:FL=1